MLTLEVIDDIAEEIKILKSPYENMTDLAYTLRCLKKEDIEEKLGYNISNDDMAVIRLMLCLKIEGEKGVIDYVNG